MSFFELLEQRNQACAAESFSADLKIMPTKKTVIIGCVDPRVDPADVFMLESGETVIVRNVGGSVDSAMLQSMAIVREVMQARERRRYKLEQHRIAPRRLRHYSMSKARTGAAEKLFQCLGRGLEAMKIADPFLAVAVDVATLKANPDVVGKLNVSGVVYDVKTGLVQTIVPPALSGADPA